MAVFILRKNLSYHTTSTDSTLENSNHTMGVHYVFSDRGSRRGVRFVESRLNCSIEVRAPGATPNHCHRPCSSSPKPISSRWSALGRTRVVTWLFPANFNASSRTRR